MATADLRRTALSGQAQRRILSGCRAFALPVWRRFPPRSYADHPANGLAVYPRAVYSTGQSKFAEVADLVIALVAVSAARDLQLAAKPATRNS
jgi:hypothetical protein